MVNYKELVEFIVKHLVTQPESVVGLPMRTWGE